MARIRMDVWGRTEVEPNFNIAPLTPYETDAPEDGDGAVYQRFFDRTSCMVHRTTIITKGGRQNIKFEVGYGSWENRATLTYEESSNYPKTVEV